MVYITMMGTVVSATTFIIFVDQDVTYEGVNKEWTFGQIVAMIVWLPCLLALLNDVMCGPVRGRSDQLPDTMKVVRVPETRDVSIEAVSNSGITNQSVVSSHA